MVKAAQTQVEIHELLKNRWSPHGFSQRPIEDAKLFSLFEAARWSPSAANRQPWSFIVVTPDDTEKHEKLIEAMTGRNPLWAKHAPVLALALATLNPERPAANKFAYYDVGQAVAHLSIQAAAEGLHVHQMGGYDPQKVRDLFNIPDGFDPMTLIAIGYLDDGEKLPEELRQRDATPRSRKTTSEFVFEGNWNDPLKTGEFPAVTIPER